MLGVLNRSKKVLAVVGALAGGSIAGTAFAGGGGGGFSPPSIVYNDIQLPIDINSVATAVLYWGGITMVVWMGVVLAFVLVKKTYRRITAKT
jgi:hypothetical protein